VWRRSAASHIGIEQGPSDDAQRELPQLVFRIDRGVVLPRVEHLGRVRGHRIGIYLEMARLKRRCHQFPLLAVEGAIADQEPVPER
jgi:hypothetical protein